MDPPATLGRTGDGELLSLSEALSVPLDVITQNIRNPHEADLLLRVAVDASELQRLMNHYEQLAVCPRVQWFKAVLNSNLRFASSHATWT
jgi:hypothetical protein